MGCITLRDLCHPSVMHAPFTFEAARRTVCLQRIAQQWGKHSSNSNARVRVWCAATLEEIASPSGHPGHWSSKILISVCPYEPWQAAVRGDMEEEVKLRLYSKGLVISSIQITMQAYILKCEFDPMLLHCGTWIWVICWQCTVHLIYMISLCICLLAWHIYVHVLLALHIYIYI